MSMCAVLVFVLWIPGCNVIICVFCSMFTSMNTDNSEDDGYALYFIISFHLPRVYKWKLDSELNPVQSKCILFKVPDIVQKTTVKTKLNCSVIPWYMLNICQKIISRIF